MNTEQWSDWDEVMLDLAVGCMEGDVGPTLRYVCEEFPSLANTARLWVADMQRHLGGYTRPTKSAEEREQRREEFRKTRRMAKGVDPWRP